MALTKVSGHIIDQPFDVGIITATNFRSGVATVGTMHVTGNLQVDGTTTTLDTIVTEVDRLEVSANNSTVGLAVTQSGSGDILNLYDGAAEVFSVADGGGVTITDSIIHSGDENTKIRFPAADTFTVETAGSERLRIDSNGYVDIQTGILGDNPSDNFTLNGRTQPHYGFNLVPETGVPIGIAGYRGIAFASSGTERMRISEGGNVGINDSTPDNAFSIKGIGSFDGDGNSFYFGSNFTGTGQNYIGSSKHAQRFFLNNASSNGYFSYSNTGSPGTSGNAITWQERLRITSAGNVSIGINDPLNARLRVYAAITQTFGSAPLAIFGSGFAAGYYSTIGFGPTNSTYPITPAGIGYVATSSTGGGYGDLVFGTRNVTTNTAPTERLRITKDGKVGINEDNPGAKLHIVDTVQATANGHSQILILGDDSGTDGESAAIFMSAINASNRGVKILSERQSSSNNHDLIFQVSGVSAIPTERLRITSAGKVRVPDNGKFTAGAGDDLQIWSDNTDQYIRGEQNQLLIRSNNLKLQSYLGENYIHAANNNAVSLYYDNSKKLETTTTGVTVTGSLTQTTEYPSIRPILDLNFAATKTLDRRITFTRDSIGTYYGENGLVKYASNNVPRFDHDPTTGESLGLLIEESRTNVAESSEDFGNTSFWSPTSQTITTNVATAPDGTLTADNVVPAAGSAATRYLYFSASAYSMSASASYTTSIFVKKNGLRYFALQAADNGSGSGLRAGFDLDNGTVVTSNVFGSASGPSASIVEFPNGWFRCILTGTSASGSSTGKTAFSFSSALDSNASVGAITADGSSGGYVWGHQVEAAAFATSYIPTTGTTATRAQDTPLITGTNFTDFYNQSEGTLVLSADIGYLATSNQAAVAFEDTSNVSATFIAMGYNTGGGGSGTAGAWYNSSGTTSAFAAHNTGIPINTEFKQAYAYKLNDFSSVANGSTPITDTSGGLTSLIDRVRFGIYHYDGMTSGHIRQFKYYNKRLPNAQLQGLTQQ